MSQIEASKTALLTRLRSRAEGLLYADDGAAEIIQVTVGLSPLQGKLIGM